MVDFEKIEQITGLLVAEKKRDLTRSESQILDEWLKESTGNQALYDSFKDDTYILSKIQELSVFDSHKAYSEFRNACQQKQPLRLLRKALRVAAVFVLFLFGTYFLFLQEKNIGVDSEQLASEIKIKPGSSKAILHLANGTLVALDSEEKEIITDHGVTITNDKKEVVYQTGDKNLAPSQIEYNSIEIPRGGEYQLTLSDGTRVWLNSETSIQFPVIFSGNTREVKLAGEAYFEVAEDKKHPFVVCTSQLDILVTGTEFSVRAYLGEKNTATLIVGEVNVTQKQTKESLHLKPGQQVVALGLETHLEKVNVEQYIAWKNGRIYFENNSLEEIFSDLSRWYDVEISYANEKLKDLRFSVDIPKYTEFNEVFEIMELTKKVKFKIEKTQVIVM